MHIRVYICNHALGTVSLAALQLGHSVITIMESEENRLDIFQQLQDKFVVND